MEKVWTVGLTWGILAWIPYFIDLPLPFLLKITLGLPVLCAGYFGLVVERFFTTVSSSIIFSLSLPTGILLAWCVSSVIHFFKDERARIIKSGVK